MSKDSIKTDPDKIKVLKDWPVPRNVKDVRMFLGFAGYYRRFLRGFSVIVRPLNDLLVGVSTKRAQRRIQLSCGDLLNNWPLRLL